MNRMKKQSLNEAVFFIPRERCGGFFIAWCFFIRSYFIYAFRSRTEWRYVVMSYSFKVPFPHGFKTRGRAQGVAIRPLALPRGPIPLDPNAFYMCEALSGFDSCWDVLPTRESELGKEFLWVKKISLPTSHSSFRDAAQLVENAAGIFLQLKRGQKRGGGPGGGENAAFRSELFSPPPGLETM